MVEVQLLNDLANYSVTIDNLRFDWSESCIEGRDTIYLDGSLENFSGMAVFDGKDQLVAEGCMEFVHEGNFFLAYWDYLTIFQEGKMIFDKRLGIPNHVWKQIPEDLKWAYEHQRQSEG